MVKHKLKLKIFIFIFVFIICHVSVNAQLNGGGTPIIHPELEITTNADNNSIYRNEQVTVIHTIANSKAGSEVIKGINIASIEIDDTIFNTSRYRMGSIQDIFYLIDNDNYSVCLSNNLYDNIPRIYIHVKNELSSNTEMSVSYRLWIEHDAPLDEILLPCIEARSVQCYYNDEWHGPSDTNVRIKTKKIKIENHLPQILSFEIRPRTISKAPEHLINSTCTHTFFKNESVFTIRCKASDRDNCNLTYNLFDLCNGTTSCNTYKTTHYLCDMIPTFNPGKHEFNINVFDGRNTSENYSCNISIFILPWSCEEYPKIITTEYHTTAVNNVPIVILLIALWVILAVSVWNKKYVLFLSSTLLILTIILVVCTLDNIHYLQMSLCALILILSTTIFVVSCTKRPWYVIWSMSYALIFTVFYYGLPMLLNKADIPIVASRLIQCVSPTILVVIVVAVFIVALKLGMPKGNFSKYLYYILCVLIIITIILSPCLGDLMFKEHFNLFELILISSSESVVLLATTYLTLSLTEKSSDSSTGNSENELPTEHLEK